MHNITHMSPTTVNTRHYNERRVNSQPSIAQNKRIKKIKKNPEDNQN